mgnify:CR=1 FL=1
MSKTVKVILIILITVVTIIVGIFLGYMLFKALMVPK